MRAKYTTRNFLLRDERVRESIIAEVRKLKTDSAFPLEIVIREQIKGRKLDQNAFYWSGPLRDIAEQAWIDDGTGHKRQFSAEVWHLYFRKELLPEEYDPAMCKEGYQKWAYDPAGERVLIGSTTQLTVKGFSEFLEAVHAFGASLGVLFHASPNQF